MAAPKLNVTKNYDLFKLSEDNRDPCLDKHGALLKSMQTYGFLKSFPISCVRDKHGRLIVRDGQHRLLIARKLGLAVWWIEEDVDYDVAAVSTTPKGWLPIDYARKHARHGLTQYTEGLAFVEQHGIPVGLGFALLGGTASFGNVQAAFQNGTFAIKDRKWADAVATVYSQLVRLAPVVKSVRLLQACVAVCRVKDFDAGRLVGGAKRMRDKLESYSDVDGYLKMLEECYNFGRAVKVGLRVAAQNAMRDRNIRHNPRSGHNDAA